MQPERNTIRRPAVLSGMVLAFTLFGDSLLYAVLPVYAVDFGIPLVFLGVILSINRWIRLVSNPLAVRIFRTIGLQRAMVGACILTVLTILMYAYPLGVIWLLVARILWGICWSHLRLGSYLVVIHTAVEKLGLGMGSMQAISRSGSVFTLVVGGALVDSIGYSGGLVTMAALSALSILTVVLLGRALRRGGQVIGISSPQSRAGSPGREKGAREGTAGKEGGAAAAHTRVRGMGLSWSYAAIFINSFVNKGLVTATIARLLQERLSGGVHLFGLAVGIATVSGWLLASRHISTLVFSPLLGHLSDRHGRRPILLGAFCVEASALLAIALFPLPLWTAAGAVAVFAAGSVAETVLHAVVGSAVRTGRIAATMSTFATFDDMGAASGPLLGYVLASLIGFAATYALGAVAVCGLLLVLLSPLAYRRHPRRGV